MEVPRIPSGRTDDGGIGTLTKAELTSLRIQRQRSPLPFSSNIRTLSGLLVQEIAGLVGGVWKVS